MAWVCLRGAEASIKTTVWVYVALSRLLWWGCLSLFLVVTGRKGGCHHSGSLQSQSIQRPVRILGGDDPRCARISVGLMSCLRRLRKLYAPRQHLPKAILLTVIGTALLWALQCLGLYASRLPRSGFEQYTNLGLTAVTPVARAYWGYGSLIVIL